MNAGGPHATSHANSATLPAFQPIHSDGTAIEAVFCHTGPIAGDPAHSWEK